MQDDCITIALGLSEARVIREEETPTEITVEVEYRRTWVPCPRCGKGSSKVHSTRPQWKRDRRLWDKPVFLLVRKRRFRCQGCWKVFTEPDPVCGPRRRTSQRFCQELGQRALDQPVRHVARKEGVGEALVRRCPPQADRGGEAAPGSPGQACPCPGPGAR